MMRRRLQKVWYVGIAKLCIVYCKREGANTAEVHACVEG